MLNIVEGGLYSNIRSFVKEQILKDVKMHQRVFLIVPEQQTVVAESEMAQILPNDAPLYFEATNFTRLANTVFRAVGGLDLEYCNKTERALIMWRAITELAPSLQLTSGKKEVQAGVVERLLSAIAEMESEGIDLEVLDDMANRLPTAEARLAGKLRDLKTVCSLYKMLVKEKYQDASDDVGIMTKKYAENPAIFNSSKFYIDGFTSFTDAQYKFIAMLSKYEDVSVFLNIPREDTDAFEYSEIRRAKRTLVKSIDRIGADKKLTRLPSISTPFAECCGLLWKTQGRIDNESLQNSDALRIIEASDPYEECDFIATDILTRVKFGANFSDFAIIARNVDKYVGILDKALDSARISHFISKENDVQSFEAVKLIYAAYSVITSGFLGDDVIAYMKSSPAKITRDEACLAQLYIDTWGLGGEDIRDARAWTMSPVGYNMRRGKQDEENLTLLNEVKKKLIQPLLSFDAALKGAKTVREHATVLMNFLEQIRLSDSIDERTELLLSLGETDAAEKNSLVWDIICDALDTLVNALDDTPTDTLGFFSQLKVVFSNSSIGRIPQNSDAVTVGSADTVRISNKKHIYLIGVNRGEFPASINESSYLTDRDRSTLSTIGIEFGGGNEELAAKELYYFSRAFSYANETLTLLYTERNSSFTSVQRDAVIDRIKDVTGASTVKTREIKSTDMMHSADAALNYTHKLCEKDQDEAKRALSEIGYKRAVKIAELSPKNTSLTVSKDTLALQYGQSLALTQTRIDAFRDCPLSYFLKYNLKLSENERAEFDARNIGSFIHAILEDFFSDVERGKISLDEIDSKGIAERVYQGASDYLKKLMPGTDTRTRRDEIMIDRLCRATLPVVEGLCNEFRGSRFVPRYFELKIENGNDELPEPAKFLAEDGTPVYVYGSIDRVDTCKIDGKLYVRVVDYKTGKKVFSPSDIEEGKNLQMFLYLKSIIDTKNKNFLLNLGTENGEAPIPAGVIYVKTELGDVKINTPDITLGKDAIEKAQVRQGMILDDAASINAMNTEYLPVKFTKNGAPDKRTENRLYTLEKWNELSETLERVVGGFATRILSGDISANATNNDACTYCKFKPFCRSTK